MIEFRQGNLLAADAEALVNTVNCVGVMGKGIALQFKQAYPDNFRAYERACRAGEVQLGKMFVVNTGTLTNPRYLINFPTKQHWKARSRLRDIEHGLADLVATVRRLGLRSLAVPPLGCGNGGLEWSRVLPLIESAFAPLAEVQVLVFPPQNAPAGEAMPVVTERPRMTRARALLLCLMEQYAVPGYRLTLLEIQKLAYFLQMAGEPLRLRYVKDKYGPYAEDLHHVLQRLEGHYLRGYGDRTRRAAIAVLPGAVRVARTFLAGDAEAQERLGRVSRLIEGFENPYGLELLASLHWVAREEARAASDPSVAAEQLYAWKDRKRRAFRPEHVRKAWQRLSTENWLVIRGRDL
jgi:O-acetyl-ADP-ribose deacetylase (regulator of RNase III)